MQYAPCLNKTETAGHYITLTKVYIHVCLLPFENKSKIQCNCLVLLRESSKLIVEATKASLTDITVKLNLEKEERHPDSIKYLSHQIQNK